MRIIAKTKDYYDSLMDPSGETDIVYARFPKDHIIDVHEYFPKLRIPDYRYWAIQDFITTTTTTCLIDAATGIYFSLFLVGFCGSVYPCVTISIHQPETPIHPDKKSFFTTEDVTEFINKALVKKGIKLHTPGKLSPFVNGGIRGPQIEGFFKADFSNFTKLFNKFKSPVFVLHFGDDRNRKWSFKDTETCKITCITDPLLKEYDFFRKFDVNQTFQEISMYIGGVLGGSSPPMAEIEDKYRIEAHGFDKWSFRKMPEKKKVT